MTCGVITWNVPSVSNRIAWSVVLWKIIKMVVAPRNSWWKVWFVIEKNCGIMMFTRDVIENKHLFKLFCQKKRPKFSMSVMIVLCTPCQRGIIALPRGARHQAALPSPLKVRWSMAPSQYRWSRSVKCPVSWLVLRTQKFSQFDLAPGFWRGEPCGCWRRQSWTKLS